MNENVYDNSIQMMRIFLRGLICSGVFTSTGILNAQFSSSHLPSTTERFSLLDPYQGSLDTTYFGTTTLPRIPSSYDYNALGLFCKLDVQFEKRLRFPVLFRLGDAQSIDAWEGKGTLRKR